MNFGIDFRRITRSVSRRQFDDDEKAYTKVIGNEKPTNILMILNNSQITGKSPKNILNLPTKLVGLVSERLPVSDYLHLLKRLDESSVFIKLNNSTDVNEIVLLLRDIENRLMRFHPNIIHQLQQQQQMLNDELEIDLIDLESAKVFKLYGGVEIIKRILLSSMVVKNNSDSVKQRAEEINAARIKCKCMHILYRLVSLTSFGKSVVQDLLKDGDDFIQYLFSLLLNREVRSHACQLIEGILLHVSLLNLKSIKNADVIIRKIDEDGLSNMCKIFSVTLSDLDSNDHRYWAATQRKQKLIPLETHSIRDQNHDLLLSVPNLLPRLVAIVKRKNYSYRYANSQTEIENWLRYIDEALSDDELNDDNNNSSSNDSFNLNNNSLRSENAIFDDFGMQSALSAATKINNFVHVLYTLSLLLIGKDRKKVQRTLAKLRLASALNSLFDHLVWNCRCEYPQDNAPNQMRAHLCPEVAVKIQFLRLVHSFCDNSDYKRVVLSKDELEEILKYNKEAIPCLQHTEQSLSMQPRYICTKEKVGLLSKIVEVIKQEPFSASFRFWLTRAIESYLRGATSYADQLFLINRGIVEDTTRNIIEVNFARPKEVTQSCFDMLGELIKFNSIGFTILNKELEDRYKFDLFVRMINNSLVDSNMFLRSIFLSIDFFQKEGAQLNFDLNENEILIYFEDFDRRIRYVCRMISIINIHNLSQENVSCLNTTLVILMLANKKDQLARYLKAIKAKSIEASIHNEIQRINTSHNLLNNFKDLLMFWQSHYLQKDKDCIGLEQNSKIDFKYWKHTVELLLNPDAKNPCSLNYYLESQVAYIPSRNQVEELRSD